MLSENNQQDASETLQKSFGLKPPPDQWKRLRSDEGDSQPSPFTVLQLWRETLSFISFMEDWIYFIALIIGGD